MSQKKQDAISRVNQLVDQLFDGSSECQEATAQELNQLLQQDESLQAVYFKRTGMHAMLSRHSQMLEADECGLEPALEEAPLALEGQQARPALEAHQARPALEAHQASPALEAHQALAIAAAESESSSSLRLAARRQSSMALAFKVAALLLLALSLSFFFMQGKDPELVWHTPSKDIAWIGEKPSKSELEMGKTYEFYQGKLKLEYSHGVTAHIDSPAVFRINHFNEIEMQRGLLAVHVPRTAIGFSVMTEMGRIVDKGTAFGVDVRSDAVDLHVISGEVEVDLKEKNKQLDKQADEVLYSEDALRLQKPREEVVTSELAYSYRDFTGLEAATGVDYLLNAVMHYGDMDNILVYNIFIVVPELRQYKLPRSLVVQTPDKREKVIPKGTRITSYLVLSPRRSEKPKPVPGWCEISFKRPIEGLIMTDELLRESNQTLKLRTKPKHPKQQHIGLEGAYEKITLSKGDKYLSFEGKYMYDFGDQFRVIMTDALPETE